MNNTWFWHQWFSAEQIFNLRGSESQIQRKIRQLILHCSPFAISTPADDFHSTSELLHLSPWLPLFYCKFTSTAISLSDEVFVICMHSITTSNFNINPFRGLKSLILQTCFHICVHKPNNGSVEHFLICLLPLKSIWAYRALSVLLAFLSVCFTQPALLREHSF